MLNATAYCQGTLIAVLERLVGKKCFVYIDDIQVFGRTRRKSFKDADDVLKRHMNARLDAPEDKLVLYAREMN